MEIYSPDDFLFLPKAERELAARQFNSGAEVACHTTKNDGSWAVPEITQQQANELVAASINHAA